MTGYCFGVFFCFAGIRAADFLDIEQKTLKTTLRAFDAVGWAAGRASGL